MQAHAMHRPYISMKGATPRPQQLYTTLRQEDLVGVAEWGLVQVPPDC